MERMDWTWEGDVGEVEQIGKKGYGGRAEREVKKGNLKAKTGDEMAMNGGR